MAFRYLIGRLFENVVAQQTTSTNSAAGVAMSSSLFRIGHVFTSSMTTSRTATCRARRRAAQHDNHQKQIYERQDFDCAAHQKYRAGPSVRPRTATCSLASSAASVSFTLRLRLNFLTSVSRLAPRAVPSRKSSKLAIGTVIVGARLRRRDCYGLRNATIAKLDSFFARIDQKTELRQPRAFDGVEHDRAAGGIQRRLRRHQNAGRAAIIANPNGASRNGVGLVVMTRPSI
jgi:hypothetical protein